MDGIVFIDKPEGITSFQVCRMIKKYFNTNKVGHCGTLDPFASGLLIIGFNQATKILGYLKDDVKEYIATISLGKFYDSFDKEGNLLEEKEIVKFDKDKLEKTINSFKGNISQFPPKYSAIRVNGKHLYEYARNNEEVIINSRDVTIYDLKVLSYNDKEIEIYVKCSKGTYIRSLGVDIANKLDNLGYLSKLRRISISSFNISMANSILDLENRKLNVYSISSVCNFDKYNITKDDLKKVLNGVNLKINGLKDMVLVNYLEDSLGIYQRINDNNYKCIRGLYDEAIKYNKYK